MSRQTKPGIGKDVAATLFEELARLDEQQARAVLVFVSLLRSGFPVREFFRLISDALEYGEGE